MQKVLLSGIAVMIFCFMFTVPAVDAMTPCEERAEVKLNKCFKKASNYSNNNISKSEVQIRRQKKAGKCEDDFKRDNNRCCDVKQGCS